MNTIILFFTCFCVLYSIAVLIYLILKNKKEKENNSNQQSEYNTSNHEKDFIHPYDELSRKKFHKNKTIKSFKPSFQNKSRNIRNMRNDRDTENKKNFSKMSKMSKREEMFNLHLGFSNIEISKPGTMKNGNIRKERVQRYCKEMIK